MPRSQRPPAPHPGPGPPPLDVAGVLESAAERVPARIGFADPAAGWTYAEAALAASRIAARIAAAGVRPGQAVAWLGDNGPEAALAYFGAAWAGAVLVPLHARATAADLTRVLDHADARLVLAGGGGLERAHALARPVVDLCDAPLRASAGMARVRRAASDPAHLYYTSGSTGTPKGVILTHGNVVSHAHLAASALELSIDDVWLHAAPMFHLADAWATFAITLVGGTHRFVRRFDETAVLDALASGVTITNLVPTMWNALVRHPAAAGREYRSLRLLLSGGAAVSPDLVRRIRATFRAEYGQTYGLTETSPYLTISRLEGEERSLDDASACVLLARAGRPMPGVDVAVWSEDGKATPGDGAGRRVVPADGSTVGEVVARGPTVTPGYLRNPAADAAAFRDGWFRTGDLARRFDDGRIELVDRMGDVVNSGGEKVFSTDVERALSDAPGVREIVVVGTPDAHWGQAVTAVVVPDGAPPTLESLRAYARGRLADFKAPRRLVVVEAIPRTATGKISKRDARALAESALARTVARDR